MTINGHVENGSIILDESVSLTEGMKVRVELLEPTTKANDGPADDVDEQSMPTLYETLKPIFGLIKDAPGRLRQKSRPLPSWSTQKVITVFADSHYFIAAINGQDDSHLRARQFTQQFRGRIITTEWVLTEVADAFAKPRWRSDFISAYENLRHNKWVTIVDASHDLFERAIRLFASRPDKEWSLTDCTSFLVMEDHGIAEALTADRHFSQAGFVALFE